MNSKMLLASALTLMLMASCIAAVTSSEQSDAVIQSPSTDISDYVGDYYYYDDTSEKYVKGLSISGNSTDGYKIETHPSDSSQKQTIGISTTGEIKNNGASVTFAAVYNGTPSTNTFFSFPNSISVSYNFTYNNGFNGIASKNFWRGVDADSSGTMYDSWNVDADFDAIGFKPYYVENLFDLITGDLKITLSEGRYSLPNEFNGTSLSITSQPGVEVTITDFEGSTYMRLTNPNGWNSTVDYSKDVGLTISGISFESVVQIQNFSDVTVSDCIFEDRASFGFTRNQTTGTTTFSGNTLNYNGDPQYYALTASNTDFTISDNTFDVNCNGVNLQPKGEGTFAVQNNTMEIQDSTEEATAIQISGDVADASISIAGNDISGSYYGVTIHDGTSGTPESVALTDNSITHVQIGIFYKSDDDGNIKDQVGITADRNYFSLDGKKGIPLTFGAENGSDISSLIQENSYYVDPDMDSTDDDVVPPVSDDDELPPFIPTQPKDSGDDVTVVACAAAAVVAALMAVFLIVSYKKE